MRPAGAPAPDVQGMLNAETRPVPPVLRETGDAVVAPATIDRTRYTDPGFAARERQQLWSRCWQMACREEDIPETGDYILYQAGDTSLIVVRTAPNAIHAHVNACLHRGRLLREADGHAHEFRCPFHGFTWALDGRCQALVNGWDFAHVDPAAFTLPQVAVGRWGGFIFVNPSPAPEAFETFLELLPAHYATRGWSLADRVKTVHVRKHHRCNWKVALEAFIESFHVTETHRTAAPYLADANTQYDVWRDGRHTRMISPRGLASPNLPAMTDEAVFRASLRPALGDGADSVPFPAGSSARAAMGDLRRRALLADGLDVADATDCELLDTIQYHVFPNLVIWAGWGSYLVYRFLPDGDDPGRCTMEIMFVVPHAPGKTPAVAREPTIVGADQSHRVAAELGGFAAVFDEDQSNLAALQKGLKTMRTAGPNTGLYQEARIRHFHAMLDRFMAA
ncbi:aromatic ring-hydroxylating oxygenase subunit alpha [Sandaracinobacteroides saxicola]|uniref:Aromatic ring-hydroxylating dioxygenase subunit alpha n=1 Tax=Sandaracinobacteroides saxicola TaxID=2759707 RepID=A0A7G5IEG8_9SPHN|nr:aromatic ring-hydroxylating dioxygenase subunit alpha [Sandaracinobacteroides saxicola]QMW21760.1 aromatic ring-hydroxylating dioxygenase subunit alpha [Sandaracinobacteroides saxicola]